MTSSYCCIICGENGNFSYFRMIFNLFNISTASFRKNKHDRNHLFVHLRRIKIGDFKARHFYKVMAILLEHSVLGSIHIIFGSQQLVILIIAAILQGLYILTQFSSHMLHMYVCLCKENGWNAWFPFLEKFLGRWY